MTDPTPEMIEAGCRAYVIWSHIAKPEDTDKIVRQIWRAMIEAARK